MSALLGWLWVLSGVSLAGPQLDRIELLADDPGTFLNWELPMLGARPGITLVRFAEQVQPVWHTPWDGWTVGTSLSTQSLGYAQALGPSAKLGWRAGLQTRLLLPSGVVSTLWWRGEHIELAGGISLISDASWRRPSWSSWQALPTASVSLVRPSPD